MKSGKCTITERSESKDFKLIVIEKEKSSSVGDGNTRYLIIPSHLVVNESPKNIKVDELSPSILSGWRVLATTETAITGDDIGESSQIAKRIKSFLEDGNGSIKEIPKDEACMLIFQWEGRLEQ